MKIAQVVCAWPPYAGGIGTSARQISELLAEQHEVTNFHPNNTKPWLRYGHGAFLPQLLWQLRHYDYIYLHYPFFGAAEIIYLFKLFCRKPKLILHYHMDVKSRSLAAWILSWPDAIIRDSLLKRADLIVSASLDYIQSSKIKKYYSQHPEKFREIAFGLDLNRFQPKNLNRPANNKIVAKTQEIIKYINEKFIKKNRLDILFVGGLDRAHYFKGLPILLDALRGLSSVPWRLTIVGEGDLREHYERQAMENGISDQIDFVGKLSEAELIRSYQNTDLLVLPSINNNEAFGIVLIEALACGAPVIASDLPGVRRVFTNYQEGLLIEPNNPDDLRKKLEFIANHPDQHRAMALAARHLAEKKYDIREQAARLKSLFL